jgi:hypothetical protein
VSCPYAHQQNRSVERKHHHIVEVGLSLLAHASMPLKYWDKTFLAATYLINCLPTKVLDFSSPLEILFKEKPNYVGLRTFGCACWSNIQPFNTHKLQFRSKQCVFLGYSNLHKGSSVLTLLRVVCTSRLMLSLMRLYSHSISLTPTLVPIFEPGSFSSLPPPKVMLLEMNLWMVQ